MDDVGDSGLPNGACQHVEEDTTVALVPLPLAMQGPAAVAWHYLHEAKSIEEQIDAVLVGTVSAEALRCQTRQEDTS